MKLKQKFFKSVFTLISLSCFIISCAGIPKKEGLHEITLIGTADLQGMLDPTEMKLGSDGDGTPEKQLAGGIARVSTLIHQIKAEKDGKVIAVSAGDDLMNRYFHTFKGKVIFKLMSMAGYEIYAPGNHEFDKGAKVFATALKNSEFNTLCTDLKVQGTALDGLCQPYIIRDIDGLKLGFFSLMTEDFPFVTSSKEVTLIQNNLEIARIAVNDLKKQGADIIIALTHIGIENDRKIAEADPEIDIIFGGHSHDYFPKLEKVGKTIIVNGGEKGAYLVRLDISADASGKIHADKVHYQLIPVTAQITPDPEIEKLLAQYQQSFPEAVILGRTEVAWDMTKESLRQGESPVANLVNDLMRKQFDADIVLNNAGAFRGKKTYPPGPITDQMLKEIDEFGNYAFMLEIRGEYIAEILERSAACFDEGGFLHPSGLRYNMDMNRPAQQIGKDAEGKLSVTVKGERVRSVEVLDKNGEWVNLNPEKNYRVLSNSFLVNQEGDGYFWFKRYGQNLNNTYSTFCSILTEFAEFSGVLNPKEPDGRLTIITRIKN